MFKKRFMKFLSSKSNCSISSVLFIILALLSNSADKFSLLSLSIFIDAEDLSFRIFIILFLLILLSITFYIFKKYHFLLYNV